VLMRLCFDLRGIARGHIGPGTVINDSTLKVFLAAPSRPTANGRKIPHCPTASRSRRPIIDERSD
jgi:hypothetical protein